VHVLAGAISQLFHTIITQRRVPAAWKEARLSPIYKKGPVDDPNSYRMIAVNSVLYRLFANVIRDLVTKWSLEGNKVPDTQFGFYPGRSTMQPMFILRHMANLCKQHKEKGSSRLYTAFMDFTQAYDHVDRQALWAHLQKINMPAYLLETIQAMYEEDTYTLVDGLNHQACMRGEARLPLEPAPLCPLHQRLWEGHQCTYGRGTASGAEQAGVGHVLC
jgi:hypothetical protein